MGMNRPIRLTAALTHPVQYYAPWFRHIAKHCPEIDLTVLYATRPTPAQQGVGFGEAFEWDISLMDGYHCRVIRPARPRDSVHSDDFWGLDVPEVARAILESRPDVVLLAGWHSVTQIRALWACRRERIPVLYRGDTHLGNTPTGWRHPVWAARTWLLLRMFSGYLSVGRRARTYLRRFGTDESRAFDAPHCVDNEFFAASAAPHQTFGGRAKARASFALDVQDFVVLFVGKLEPVKRPVDLIQAMARLGPAASLLMIGTGELEPECRAESERLGLRVAWAGFLNQTTLGSAYAAADCLVLPSGTETWGLVVNEALATGLPCVVSDRVGCAADLVTPGETGEVFPAGDVAALADAMTRLRARSAAGHDWAAACRERVARYSLEGATSGLLAACRAVTRQGQRISAPRVVACCGSMIIVSGLERMNFEVLRVLRERGAEVHCIVNSWENHRIVALAEAIGASWSTGYYWHRLDRHTRDARQLVRMAWDILMTSLGLVRDARRFRATHVLIGEHATVLRNAPALVLLRLTGVKVLLYLQNAPAPGLFYRRLWRWAVAPLVDHLVCCAAHVQRALVAHGVSRTKTSVISNVAPHRAGSGDAGIVRDPRKIIYVGQIIPEKGLDLLLDALGLLVARGHDACLTVVGPMDGWEAPAYAGYRERLVRRAGAPDLTGRVEFLGWREDVPALLASAGIHCCPSRPEMGEGLPLVCVEAKRAGLPSVAFPIGPFPELIAHREDGWVCNEISAAALAEGIEYFLADPTRLERAGRAARTSADRFSREAFAATWWNVFVPPSENS
jgi:glycosyltransferase involved in cell wall biosynthesis